jgi:hypothetical protein
MIDPFEIKLASGGDIKAERGLSAASASVLGAYEYVIDPSLLFSDYHDLKSGTETTFDVSIAELPPNANVRALQATLYVADADAPADRNTTSVAITKSPDPNGAGSGSFNIAVDQATRPRNLQLKLSGGDPIWSFGPVLSASMYALPDFSQHLNTYLDRAHATGPVSRLTFVCKSDTPGKVGVRLSQLEFSQVRTESWPNPLDRTTRLDRNLALSFGEIDRLPPLDALATGQGRVELLSVKLDASGQFGPDRLLGDVETHDGHLLATISGDYALAQRVSVSADVFKSACRCTGINAFLTADSKTELYLEVQPGASGYPSADAPLAKANVSFTPADPNSTQPWTFARFDAPVDLKPSLSYWVVIKGGRGVTRLGLRQQPAATYTAAEPVVRDRLLVSRGGMIWKTLFRPDPVPPIVALLGLIYLPGADEQTAAVELIVTGVPSAPPLRQSLDPARAPRTLELTAARQSWNTAIVEVRSHAAGSLTLANLIREYQVK